MEPLLPHQVQRILNSNRRISFSTDSPRAHIWFLRIDDLETVDLRCLSPDEHDRARRFRFDADRVSFAGTRAVLRQLLAHYAAELPASLEFSYGPNGKPFLANNNRNVSFNVSRSRPYSVIAVTNGLSPGIDIEVIRPVQEYRGIASRYFTPRELEWLNSRDEKDRVRNFFRIWVLKEAVLKADGRGLSMPLNEVDMELSDTPLSASLWRLWRLWELGSREDCLAAVALDSAITSFVTFDSPQDCPPNP